MPKPICVTAIAAIAVARAQGLLRRVGAEQTVEHARQQRIARAHRAGDADLGRRGVQRRADAEPVHAVGAVGNHHMLDALRVQAARRFGLGRDRYHLATEHFGQLFGVGLDQPWTGLEPGAQGFAAGVQGDFQPEVFQAHDQRLQPLRADALRQAAGDHDRVMPGRNLVESIKQRLLRRRADQRPRAIDVGDAPIAFRQFDIAAGFAGHADKRIDKTALGEQRFERLQIVFTEKTADGQLMPEVRQHLRHVHALAGGMGVHRRRCD